jgi:hypothetical protein
MVERYAPLYVSLMGSRIQAMNDALRGEYQDRLLKLVGNLADPRHGWRVELGWLVHLDGTIRSVFPLPVPAPSSWWAGQVQRSFEMIETRTAQEPPLAALKLLKVGISVDSPDYQKYAGEEDPALATRDREQRGRVLWPLRAWLSIPSAGPGQAAETRAARVLFSHSQGFTWNTPAH